MYVACLYDSPHVRKIRELYPNSVAERLIDDIDYPYPVTRKASGICFTVDGKIVAEVRTGNEFPFMNLRIKWLEDGQMRVAEDRIQYREEPTRVVNVWTIPL